MSLSLEYPPKNVITGAGWGKDMATNFSGFAAYKTSVTNAYGSGQYIALADTVLSYSATTVYGSDEWPPSGAFDKTSAITYGRSGWHTADIDFGSNVDRSPPRNIYIKMPENVIITSYSLAPRTDNNSLLPQMPRKWTLYGSTTYPGSTWVPLDSETDIAWADVQPKTFQVSNTTAYIFYKIAVFRNSYAANNVVSIGEITLYGYPSSGVSLYNAVVYGKKNRSIGISSTSSVSFSSCAGLANNPATSSTISMSTIMNNFAAQPFTCSVYVPPAFTCYISTWGHGDRPVSSAAGDIANSATVKNWGPFTCYRAPIYSSTGGFNNRPFVTFSGGTTNTSDYMELPDRIYCNGRTAISGYTQGVTVYTLFYCNSNIQNGNTRYFLAAGGILQTNSGYPLNISASLTSSGNYSGIIKNRISANNWISLCVRSTNISGGSRLDIFLNGVLCDSLTASTPTGDIEFYRFAQSEFGDFYNDLYWGGRQDTLITWPRSLSDIEVANIDKYCTNSATFTMQYLNSSGSSVKQDSTNLRLNTGSTVNFAIYEHNTFAPTTIPSTTFGHQVTLFNLNTTSSALRHFMNSVTVQELVRFSSEMSWRFIRTSANIYNIVADKGAGDSNIYLSYSSDTLTLSSTATAWYITPDLPTTFWKLFEYPPLAFTGDGNASRTQTISAGTSAGGTLYGAGSYTASCGANIFLGMGASKAFDKTLSLNDNLWATNTATYNTSGEYTGSETTSNINGVSSATISGEYLQLQMPAAKPLHSYIIVGRDSNAYYQNPSSWVVLGSSNGSTWIMVHAISNVTDWNTSTREARRFIVNFVTSYVYYRIVVTAVQSNASSGQVAISEWRLFSIL